MARPTAERRIYVASETFVASVDGAPVMVRADVTRVEEGHPLLRDHPDLFRPVDAHYKVERATAMPGEVRG